MFIGFRISLPVTDGKKLPERMLVAKWGRNEVPSKNFSFLINETTVRELPKNTLALGFDKPVLDFEHNTLPGSEEYKASKEPRSIAATGGFSVVPGEGLFYTPERYTPEGEKSLLGGHHPDLSPALGFNAKGEAIVAHSVALCRHGSVPGLHAFSADNPLFAKLVALGVETATAPISAIMNHKELLCLILGLSATASDTEIATAAKTFATNAAASAQGFTAFNAQLKSANDAIVVLQGKFDEQERAQVTALAIRDGKIVPLAASKLPLADFKAFVAELPANQVPLDQRTPEGIKAFSVSAGKAPAANTSDEDDVRRQLGISEADWKK